MAYYRPYKGLFVLDFSCAVVAAVLELSFPLFVNYVIDTLLPSLNWAVILGASALPAQPERRAAAGAPAAVSRTISLREFHAPQSAHWPCHLLCSAPHSVQT